MKNKLRKLLFILALCIIFFHLNKAIHLRTVYATFYMTFAVYLFLFLSTVFLLEKIKVNKNWIVSTTVMLSMLFSGEVYFKYVRPSYLSYPELVGEGGYVSRYQFLSGTIDRSHFYLGHSPYSSWISKTSEFTYTHHYNNIGFRGEDVLQKKSDEYRILTFSDSFTEGVGAPDDSTWSILLQEKLRTRCDTNFSVINLGLAGSDPVFALRLLSGKYKKLQPDAVVLLVNSSDISDVLLRGGLDRFDEKGNLQYTTGPWWEYFYAVSFIMRRIIHDVLHFDTDFIRFSTGSKDQQIETYLDAHKSALVNLTESIQEMYQFCLERNIAFRVVFVPKGEGGVSPGLQFVQDNLKMPNEVILDITQQWEAQENLSSYYWEIDCHFKGVGYNSIAEFIFISLNCFQKPPP